MLRFAPRYDPRILDALRLLDDRYVPIAETCRRVGVAAERLGLPRPSYVHLRRIILIEREREDAERARRDEIRRIMGEVALDVIVGRKVDAYEVADRISEAGH